MTLRLAPHDPRWHAMFNAERTAILGALEAGTLSLHHIGSTAVPGLVAKPIIDILGVVKNLTMLDGANGRLERLGYAALGSHGLDGRRYFRKRDGGDHPGFHLHCYGARSPHPERHLAFRDFLRVHPDEAAAYGKLKLGLMAEGPISRADYAGAKAKFVTDVERRAIQWMRSRAS